ncbi:MAG: hypothetical protein WBL50_01050 [Candidatus Acidiferrum sp.]
MFEVWTYVLGPVLALLPQRWREAIDPDRQMAWIPATILSGTIEALAELIALIYWYSYSVGGWAQQAVTATIKAHPEAAIREDTVGFAALTLMAMHPLTWVIACVGVEGPVRALGAAFAGNVNGSSALWALDRIVLLFRRRGDAGAIAGNAASFVNALRDKFILTRTPLVADEIYLSRDGPQELMEIHSCRPKEDWDPPRVMRYQGVYYRLESCSKGEAPRPFHFNLRKLSAGVRGRTVLEYLPDLPPITRGKGN